ncbi:MAG: DnaJ domain-containing protein [Acidobacteria bacterium]|nr:DnaJ domain-containing protein [Acidobacteriota bacterium]
MSIHSKFPDVLLNLGSSSQSGVFRARNASIKKQLVLKKGMISFAESSLPEEHLARIMVSMGFLKQSDLREIVSGMKSGKNSEEAIEALNLSDGEAVHKGLREQVIVVLSSLLGWRDFDMQFYRGEDLIKNRRNIGLNIPEMLVCSARRAVSKRIVTAPQGFLEGTIAVEKDRAEKGMEFPLDDTESYAYVRAHDEIPLRELLSLISSRDETAPEEVLLRLYVLGLIRPETSKQGPSSDIRESTVSDTTAMLIEDMLLRFEKASLYEILSIATDAGPDEIQAAYHDMAKLYHPDHFQSGEYSDDMRRRVEQVFTYMNKAYMTLRDQDLRARYDKSRLTEESEVEAAIKSKQSTDAEEEEMIDALFRQGRKSLAQGEYEKAAKELKSCVHLRPEKANYNYWLGLAESEVPGLYKSAEQHLLKAIELESMSTESHIALVKLYLKVHLPRKAAALLKEVMRWDPEHPEAKKLLEKIETISLKP